MAAARVAEGVRRRDPSRPGRRRWSTSFEVAELDQLGGDRVRRRTSEASSGISPSQASTPPATSTPAIRGPMM